MAFSVVIFQKMVSQCKVHVKFVEAFQRYDRHFSKNPESIISEKRGFQKIQSLKYPVYVVSECQALSTGDEQEKVDKMPLVYLPKKHLKLKVKKKPFILFQTSFFVPRTSCFLPQLVFPSHNFTFFFFLFWKKN